MLSQWPRKISEHWVNAMPEWQSSVSLNTLVDGDGGIEALMLWAGERVTRADAYGVARTLPAEAEPRRHNSRRQTITRTAHAGDGT